MTAPCAVADGVWVITGELSATRPSAHRDDLLRAAVLPEWRAREFLAGRGLLRHLLTAVRPELARYAVVPDAYGKPWLRACPDVGVSVSHSRGSLAAAVAVGARVGVDVQRPEAAVTESFARRLLGERGAEALAGLPAARAAEEVAWVWTAQEACVKADGRGLAGRPWSVGVAPGSRSGGWGPYRWVALRGISATPLSCAYGPPDHALVWTGGEDGRWMAGERTTEG
ncbi:4'-phosphopantetheinyl transferase family protein [Streptomyces sp. NPDC059176]|uniref:4'-phosphopantetheinyl transferase family protein n=1 Tax=Streptomyces sp. NPDC059176 TaxID=3346758 RepID=UPI0036AFA7A3